MKKTLIPGLALVLAGGVAHANYCARDTVPAATLLVPWAIVDLKPDGTPDPSGYTTLLAVTNVSSAAALIHVTVWDAKANHVVDWDELLTGYDVWTINFRDVLTGHFDYFDTGNDRLLPIPINGPPQYGPTTNYTGSHTPLAPPQDPDPALAGCHFPYGSLPSLGPLIVQNLQVAINAQDMQDASACRPGLLPRNPPWLTGLAKSPVFFYVTVDVVNSCSTIFPDEAAYWTTEGTDPLTGLAFDRIPAARNVLTGDVIWVNSVANYSESMPAVRLEADPAYRTSSFTAFYDRYTHRATPVQEDDREPLATAFGFRFINSAPVSTQIVVWKDSVEADHGSKASPPSSANKGITLSCAPYAYYAFDENENASYSGPGCFSYGEPNVIPFATQSAPLNSANWDGLPAPNGWMILVFDPPAATPSATNVGHQAWVGVRYLAGGYSTATEADTLGNHNCFDNQVLPKLGVNVKGAGTFPQSSAYLP